jgi:predicted DNA-binding protein (MmcQ/YjbR family)
MFRDDDFGLPELRRIALDFPDAFEKISHGRPVFCAPKMFAMYGANSKTKVPDEVTPFPHSLLVKADEADRTALAQDARFFYPMYLGPYGWLGLDLSAAPPDWDEIGELVDASYRMIASKKLVNQLDHRHPGAI